MKKIALFLLLNVFCVGLSFSQTKAEAQVAAAVEKLRLAMIDPEGNKLNKLLSDQLSYGHSGGKLEGKADFMASLLSGNSDFVSIELSKQRITISRKTALVRHHLEAKTNDKGNPAEVHLEVLLVFQKEHGDWKLLARQAIKK